MTIKSLLTILLSVVLISCGGGGGSTDNSGGTTGTFATGVFLDSPVEGLTYETSSGLSGTTDSDGTFSYKTGDSVTFKLHNITLGSGSASGVMFPKDMVSSLLNADLTDTEREQSLKQAHKIAQLLQSLDDDGNADNGINITGLTTAQVNSLTATADAITTILEDHTKDLNASDLTGIIPTASGGTFTSIASATAHVEKTFTNQKEYAFKGLTINSSTDSKNITDYIGVRNYPAKIGNDNITSIAAKVRINRVSLDTSSGEQQARSGLKLRLSKEDGSEHLYFLLRAAAYHNFNDLNSENKNKVRLTGYVEHARYDSESKSWVWTKAKGLHFNDINYVDINKPFAMKLEFNSDAVIFSVDDYPAQTYAISDVVADVMTNDGNLSLDANDFTTLSEVAIRNRIKYATTGGSINSTFSKIKINDVLIDNTDELSGEWNVGNITGFEYTVPTSSVMSNAGNDNPQGIWSDGTTMWVVDGSDAKIYAYNMSDKTRDAAKDFDTLSAAGNDKPVGIWSDGNTMWVADYWDDKIYAYSMFDKSRKSDNDKNNINDPTYIASDGKFMWVHSNSYSSGYQIPAYGLSTVDDSEAKLLGISDGGEEINLDGGAIWRGRNYDSSAIFVKTKNGDLNSCYHELNGGHTKSSLTSCSKVVNIPGKSRGIWANGIAGDDTIWFAVPPKSLNGGAKILAYNAYTGEREEDKDF
jgi:hypothetical protein